MHFSIFRTSPLNHPNFRSSAPDHPRTKFHSIILLLHVLSQHQPQQQISVVIAQTLDAHQPVPKILPMSLIQLTFVLEPSYKLITACTNTSANPFFLNAHSITFLGTLSNVFSESLEHMYSFCSLSGNSSCILLRINNA